MGSGAPTAVTSAGASVTVRVPMHLARRGGRKVIIAPSGVMVESFATAMSKPKVVGALVKTLARAYRWRDMLESGSVTTVAEIAKAEKINGSYVSRVVRLTLLAPDIVEAILDGRQAAQLQLNLLLKPFPVDWEAQQQTLIGGTGAS